MNVRWENARWERVRKRPITVDAIELTEKNLADVALLDERLHLRQHTNGDGQREDSLVIETPEGVLRAHPGDFLMRGVEGELYPCPASVYHATYERTVRASTTPVSLTGVMDINLEALTNSPTSVALIRARVQELERAILEEWDRLRIRAAELAGGDWKKGLQQAAHEGREEALT